MTGCLQFLENDLGPETTAWDSALSSSVGYVGATSCSYIPHLQPSPEMGRAADNSREEHVPPSISRHDLLGIQQLQMGIIRGKDPCSEQVT